jgi:hypothetical protein
MALPQLIKEQVSDSTPDEGSDQRQNPGYHRVVRHLCGSLCLSEAEAQHILSELARSILIGCDLHGSVRIPRFGQFIISDNQFKFSQTAITRSYAQSLTARTQSKIFTSTALTKTPHVVNHQNLLSDSLINYIQLDYPKELDWPAPTGKIYTFAEVKTALLKIKQLNDDYLNVFICRLVSSRRRDTVAHQFHQSEATIKRRFDAVTSSILLMLLHPDLITDRITLLYRN